MKLISNKYRKLLQRQHAQTIWGVSGQKYAGIVSAFKDELGAATILDYGSGRETLRSALEVKGISVTCYDPGIPVRSQLPIPHDLVVCTDVMEHIETNCVDAVLSHIAKLATKGVFFSIVFTACKTNLLDGRNAHVTVMPREWWEKRLKTHWRLLRIDDQVKHARFWMVPR